MIFSLNLIEKCVVCVYRLVSVCFNPFTAPACNISRLKCAHIHASKHVLWWYYNKSTFNTMHFDRNPFACSSKGGQKSLNSLKFGTFIGRFLSDSIASMAVKGLNLQNRTRWCSDDDKEVLLSLTIRWLWFQVFEAPSEQKQLVTARAVISNVLIRKTVGIIHYCVAMVLTLVLFTLFPPPPSSPSQPHIHTQTSQSSAQHLVSFIAAIVKYTHCVFGGGGGGSIGWFRRGC